MSRIIRTDRSASFSRQDVSYNEVITANAAAAARLGVPHNSLGHYAERILRSSGIRPASPIEARAALRAAISKVLHGSDASAEATRMARSLSDILRNGIEPADLRKHGSPRVKVFAQIAEAYIRILRNERLIDAGSALVEAARFRIEPKKLLIYGFFRARQKDVEFIDKAAAEGSIIFIPTGPENLFAPSRNSLEWLEKRGWTRQEDTSAEDAPGLAPAARFSGVEVPHSTEDNFTAFCFSDIEAEVRGVFGSAKILINSGLMPSDIAVVCRSPEVYDRSFASVSREYGLPVESHSKVKLADTDVGDLVLKLLACLESGLEFEAAAAFLHHRLGPGLEPDVWKQARIVRSCGAEVWSGLGVDLSWLPSEEDRTASDWFRWLRECLTRFNVRQKAGFSAAETAAFNLLTDSFAEAVELAGEGAIGRDAFAAIVYDLLATCETPLDPSSGGIALHQPDTIIGGRFKHVFVVGMAEGMLPLQIADDPILDFHDRKQLAAAGVALDSASDLAQWEALSFYCTLLTSDAEITFTYPAFVDRNEKPPSSYFGLLGISPKTTADIGAFSRQELRRCMLRSTAPGVADEVIDLARRQYRVESSRESAGAYDEYDGITGRAVDIGSRMWSVSQLTTLGQCAFRWFLQQVLRAYPGAEGDTDLQSNTMGSLYHKTLQIAAEHALEAADIRTAMLANLEEAFTAAEKDENIAVTGLPNWRLRRGEHLKNLRNAINSPDFLAEGAKVIGTEVEFDGTWEGFALRRGRIDRVDETPDGIAAVDYKLGSSISKVQDENGKLSIDLQLPIYSQSALPAIFPEKNILPGRFFSILQRKNLRKQDETDLMATAERLKQILREGSFPIRPDARQEACNYCDYDAVCRRGARQARKGTAE
jgi:RecB family exonuclease